MSLRADNEPIQVVGPLLAAGAAAGAADPPPAVDPPTVDPPVRSIRK